VNEIFRLENFNETEEVYLCEMNSWVKLCKRMKINNKPLIISFNDFKSGQNNLLKVFLNSSKVIEEEEEEREETDCDFEEEMIDSQVADEQDSSKCSFKAVKV